MNNSLMSNSQHIEEIAADWLARRDSGKWTAADEAELEVWLKAATAHWAAYVRLRAAWQQAARLKAIGAGLKPGELPARDDQRFLPFFGNEAALATAEQSAPQARQRRWRMAASFAAAVLLAVTLYAVTPRLLGVQTYATPVGGVAAIPLTDGSQVTLNTDSRIRVVMNKTGRQIRLEKGEAFFVVAKDPARPFVVQAGNERVVAVGTQFSVRRERRAVQVVVTEGRVRIEPDGQRAAAQLGAGAVARATNLRVEVQQRDVPEAEEYLTWRSGFVTFKDVELTAAVAEFNRYTQRRIVIADPSIASIRIGGSFRLTNVDAFLRILRADFPIEVEEEADAIVLTRR
jgi:transmembrane sensor